jgi:hypothetical protein
MKKGNDDNQLVYFKGGLITKLEFKRAMIAILFGVIGIAIGAFINQGVAGPNTITKIIVLIFTVAGYLVGAQIFPKNKS